MQTHDRFDPVVGSRVLRRVAVLVGAVACSLAVAAALHLSGHVRGRSAPFDADHAGVAEALLCLVLAVGAVALWRSGPRARQIGVGTVGFTIAGFCWGLSITARGGHWPDIAYHLAILPPLVGSLVALVRDRGPSTPADPVA